MIQWKQPVECLLRWVLLAGIWASAGDVPRPEISAESLSATLNFLSGDAMGGRASLSQGSEKARNWLIQEMKARGLAPAGSRPDSFQQAYRGGINLLGILYPDGEPARAPVVLLSAHYDHLGYSCKAHPMAGSSVCNGAVDNATSVAALLEVVTSLTGSLQSPVAMAFWDGEERGFLGSKHFAAKPSFETSALKLMINLDTVGLNLFKGQEKNHFAIGTETGGTGLFQDLQRIAGSRGLRLVPLSYAFGYQRSDLTSFFSSGYRVPSLLLTDGDGSVYHSTADEAQRVNLAKTVEVAELVAQLTLDISRNVSDYAYLPPQPGNGPPRASYHDAVVLVDLAKNVLKSSAQNQLNGKQKAQLKTGTRLLEKAIHGGPDHFREEECALTEKFGKMLVYISRNLPLIP